MSDTIDAMAGGPIDTSAPSFDSAQGIYDYGGALTGGIIDVGQTIGSGVVDVFGSMSGYGMGFSVDQMAVAADMGMGGSSDSVAVAFTGESGGGSSYLVDLNNLYILGNYAGPYLGNTGGGGT